jgi:hypothetical protein
MKINFLAISILFAFSLPGFSQDISMPDIKGYKKVTDYPVYLPQNLNDYIDGAAGAYLAYDFADLHVAEYKKGKNVIKLEIYRLGSNTMAFGIYSSERSPSFRYIILGSQGYIADGAINFYKGNYYVKLRIYSKNESTITTAESLAHHVDEILPGKPEVPPSLALFPAEGKKKNEETYINENVLGHKFLKGAFKASYESGPDNFSIFILENKTPEDAIKTAKDYFASVGEEWVDSDAGRYVFKDGYNGTIFLALKDNKVVIITGLSKDQTDIADKYTSEILK